MDLNQISERLKEIKNLIREMENNSLEIIVAAVKLENKYRKAVNSEKISNNMAAELTILEQKVKNILKPFKENTNENNKLIYQS